MRRTVMVGEKGISLVSLWVAVLALTLAVAGPAMAGPPAIPCGEATAPQCGGQCPAGQRCIASAGETINIFAYGLCLVAEEPNQSLHHEAQGANGDCECAEVRCGGTLLGQDQGCCNGRPFTLGTQGCCHGVIVDAGAVCECDGEEIDLAVAGCCGEPGDPVFPRGSQQIYDPALQTCCQQPMISESCSGTVSTTSTFNLGFECCPGSVASESQFCDGQCAGSECASSGCCQCTECFSTAAQCAAGGPTVIEGVPISCLVGCYSRACDIIDFVPVQNANGMCFEDGSCLATVEPVPAVTHTGLFVAVGLLVAASGLAFVRRRRWWNGA